jgi:glycolate oxidase
VSTTTLQSVASQLRAIVRDGRVFFLKEERASYEQDNTCGFSFDCDAVVIPAGLEELQNVVKFCNEHNLAIIPRGGGTGLAGGALALKGGIILSLEKFDTIESIDPLTRTAVVGAGVITQNFREAVEEVGLYFPIIPGSEGSSMIGGNVATNVGSPYSAKYGTIKHYVLNLQVVLANGEVIETGANVTKQATGLNLTDLFIGSEGTLGLITKITLKLLAPPAAKIAMLFAFVSEEKALASIDQLMLAGITPAYLEFIDRAAINISKKYLDETIPFTDDSIDAHLLLGLESDSEDTSTQLAEKVSSILSEAGAIDNRIALDKHDRKVLWKLRDNIGPSLTANGGSYRDIDVCLPRTALPQFRKKVKEIAQQNDLKIYSFGHVLDGNLHTMIHLDQHVFESDQKIQECIDALYAEAAALGAAVSGEHGIGFLQEKYLLNALSDAQQKILRKIKLVFDPNQIMNPGKLGFPNQL